MKKIIDIPLTSVASVELFLNKFRYSIAQVSAQAQKKRRDCKAYVVTGGMWNRDGSACPLLKEEGTMPNNGAVSKTIDGLTETSAAIPAGYTTGGTVSLDSSIEDALASI